MCVGDLSCQWTVQIPIRLKKTSKAVEEAVWSEFALFGRQLQSRDKMPLYFKTTTAE